LKYFVTCGTTKTRSKPERQS